MGNFDPRTLHFVNLLNNAGRSYAEYIGIDPFLVLGGPAEEFYSMMSMSGVELHKGIEGNAALDLYVSQMYTHEQIAQNLIDSKSIPFSQYGSIGAKLSNPAILDMGYGNIKLSTAIQLINDYINSNPSNDPFQLKQYVSDYHKLASDLSISVTSASSSVVAIELTAKLSVLMTAEAIKFFELRAPATWVSADQATKMGLVATYYNRGREIMTKDADQAGANYKPVPEKGGDIALQNAEAMKEKIEESPRHCFVVGTLIDMWPTDPDIKPNANGLYNKAEVQAKIWQKPIEQITPTDWVVSFDDAGNLQPGKVTRTFTNQAKIILDFFGTGVTPGHAYYRADSTKAYKFEPLIDILRADGVVQESNGALIRAATGVPVGDPCDRFVWAITGDRSEDGRSVKVKAKGRIRLGTRLITDDGKDFCVDDLIKSGGGIVTDEGLIHVGGAQMPFHWAYGDTLPKPEDYILKRSGTSLEDIYKAADWEGMRPDMPPPMVRDGGPVQPLSQAGLTLMPRNTPLAMHHEGYAASNRPILNRKQRKAAEARERQQTKPKKRITH